MSRNSLKVNVLLWIAQSLLAGLFIFAGTMKFLLPVEVLQQGPVALPIPFIYFIAVAEFVGGFGMVLPGIFRVHRYLTPLAAAGLVVIMAGATVVTALDSFTAAIFPFVVGLVAFAVFRGRGGLTAITSGHTVRAELIHTH